MALSTESLKRGAGSDEAARRHEAALARRRQAIGLLLLAGAILAVILVRAPQHVLFPSGWWRL